MVPRSHKNNNYVSRLRKNGDNVFEYNFLMSLDEKDYPKYLKQAYYLKTGERLNLRRPKTFNEKIQWLKIFDNMQQKTELTDKVLVRNQVREKIGEEYLKPVLWIGDKFDSIPFDSLPVSFIVKANHGCKWNFQVKNKYKYLSEKKAVIYTKMQMDGWLDQSFFGWSDFETQYKNIVPKIIIEPLLVKEIGIPCDEIEVWCFNGKAKIIQKCTRIINKSDNYRIVSSFDENFNAFDIKFYETNEIIHSEFEQILNEAKIQSETLAKDFKLVRVDWMIYQNKLFFSEMTFTPYSGFIYFSENHNELQLKLGKMLNLKGKKYGK